jgi:hypothetical protein
MSTLSRCRSCHAQIRWVKMGGTTPMAVDALPANDGSVLILVNGNARVVPVADRARCVTPLYKSHFATCPNAVAHRRRR